MRFKAFFAAAFLGLLSNNSHAAVISVQPVIALYMNPTTFEPLAPIPPLTNPGFPVVVQVDVFMEVVSLAPGEDSFGTAAFSFELASGNGVGTIIPDPEAGGWGARPLSGPPFIPIFANDADLGTDSMDLKGILVQMATGAFTNPNDPRRNVGEPGSIWEVPVFLGSAFLEWNGLGQVSFTLNPLEVSAKLTNGQFILGEAAPSATIVLGSDVPEPSSAVLLGSCLMGLLLRRRHTMGRKF